MLPIWRYPGEGEGAVGASIPAMIGGGHPGEWGPGIHPWQFSTVKGCDNFAGRRIARDMAGLPRAFFAWFRRWGCRRAQECGVPGCLGVFPRYLTIRWNQGTWAPLRLLGPGSRWRSAAMPKHLMRGCVEGSAVRPGGGGCGAAAPMGEAGRRCGTGLHKRLVTGQSGAKRTWCAVSSSITSRYRHTA